MSSALPHVFTPSPIAVNQSLCDHPGGAIELFMLACNLETDIKLDTRLAMTMYKPTIGTVDNAASAAAAATATTPTTSPQVKLEHALPASRKFAFSVPLVPNKRLQSTPMEH